MIINNTRDNIPYEILNEYLLGGVLIKRNNKFALINKNAFSPDGSLKAKFIRKINKANIDKDSLDDYKKRINQNNMLAEKRKEMYRIRKFHEKRIKTHSHVIRLTTDGKGSKNKICVFANLLNQPLFYGTYEAQRPPNHDGQNYSEERGAEKALELAAAMAKKEISDSARILLELHTDSTHISIEGARTRCYHHKIKKRAKLLNLGLKIKWIPGIANKADLYTNLDNNIEYNALTDKNVKNIKKIFEKSKIENTMEL